MARSEAKIALLAVFAAFLVLIFDLALPLGVAGGVPYATVVLLGCWLPTRWHIVALAVLTTILCVVGYFFSAKGGVEWVVLTNRALALFGIWASAALVIYHKGTEVALRRSEERFRSIPASTPIAFVATDQTGAIITWNPAAEATFGYSETEILRHPLTTIMPERYRAAHETGFRRAVESGQNHIIGRTVELHGLKKSGAEFPIELSLGSWMQGEKKYFSAIIHDISERKLVEKQLSQAKDEAEQANRAKSEFLASMNHELRTPLNAVLGFAQLLQVDPKNPLSPVQNDHVENIKAGGNHLLELVNDVLDLASIEAHRAPFSLSEVDANEIVADSVVLATPLAEQQGITIIDEFSPGTTIVIRTDPLRFKQMVLNLISNAVKYNIRGGTVTLRGQETDNGFLHLSVKDTGIGISEDDRAGLFRMFHRLDADATLAKEGSGLGLYVTKLLVEQLAGRIGLVSEVGAGSTFWIELPLASNEETMIWNENLRIGVDAIDKDHQDLVSLLNRIELQPDCEPGGVGNDDVGEIVGELIDYVRYHFRREEAVMEACDFPDLEYHRGLHQNLSKQANELAKAWRRHQDPETLQRLRRFLRLWLVDHIMRMDAEIVAYTKGNGQAIREALDRLKDNRDA